MKKYFIGLVAITLCLTGCGGSKKVTCSKTVENDGEKTVYEFIGHLKNNKVDSFDYHIKYAKEEDAEKDCTSIKILVDGYKKNSTLENKDKLEYKCGKKEVTISHYEVIEALNVSEDKRRNGISKDEFIKRNKEIDSTVTCK